MPDGPKTVFNLRLNQQQIQTIYSEVNCWAAGSRGLSLKVEIPADSMTCAQGSSPLEGQALEINLMDDENYRLKVLNEQPPHAF